MVPTVLRESLEGSQRDHPRRADQVLRRGEAVRARAGGCGLGLSVGEAAHRGASAATPTAAPVIAEVGYLLAREAGARVEALFLRSPAAGVHAGGADSGGLCAAG